MLLYAITDRSLLGSIEGERQGNLVALASTWAANGVDFIQIREKDLSETDLVRLTSKVVKAVRATGGSSKILINADPVRVRSIAVDSAADGVHLHAGLSPQSLASVMGELRRTLGGEASVSVSCHSAAEVEAARIAGATLALFAPVFEKLLPGSKTLAGQGLESLAEACRVAGQPGSQDRISVLALGGVTIQNTAQCVAAGAAGVAAIRLFRDGPGLPATIKALKSLSEPR